VRVLSAASLEDVKISSRYYAPNNAVIVVAGDVKPDGEGAGAVFADIPHDRLTR
jgi:hypothetical protein